MSIYLLGSGNMIGPDRPARFRSEPPNACVATATANMTGTGVSESGTSTTNCFGYPGVALMSANYAPNAQYCINVSVLLAIEGEPPQMGSRSDCLTTPAVMKVITLSFEQITADDLPIDVNPNVGSGLRIFPDKKLPTEMTDRRKIRVRAKIGANTAGVRVYFRSFDPDDPSANAAPIDVETTANAGDDNNGNVDGTANTRAGKFSTSLTQYDCQVSANNAACFTDSYGEAVVDFTVTMQPGDNFTVAAGNDENYLSGLVLAADGINLKDAANLQTPVNTTANASVCYSSSANACRTDLLTVWRRLHIEVDSMSSVSGNSVTGTFSMGGRITSTGLSYTTIPVNVSPSLEVNRFANGRITFGTNRSLPVSGNTESEIYVVNTTGTSISYTQGQIFTLYDDDDYNSNDGGNLHGDIGESIISLPESFKYVSAEDGNYPDGKPKNVYAGAYIMPEYNWAMNIANYNQTNVGFGLNVSDTARDNLINVNRNSNNDEKDDFWITYLLFAYQGLESADTDGTINNILEGGESGNTRGPLLTEPPPCDCYQSVNCPGTTCSLFPKGGFGSLIFQEVMQDVTRTFLRDFNKTIKIKETTVPHEIGHQFGLLGDELRTTFKIMDYSNFGNDVENDTGFHPEHINILRRRIKSPGA